MDDSDVACAQLTTKFEDVDDSKRYALYSTECAAALRPCSYTCWRHRARNITTWVYYPTRCPEYCDSGTVTLKHHLNALEIALLPADFFSSVINFTLDQLEPLSQVELSLLFAWEVPMTVPLKELLVGMGIDLDVSLSARSIDLVGNYRRDRLDRAPMLVDPDMQPLSQIVDVALTYGPLDPIQNVSRLIPVSECVIEDSYLVSFPRVPLSKSYCALGRQMYCHGRVPLNEFRFWFDRPYAHRVRQFRDAHRFHPPHTCGVQIDLVKTFSFQETCLLGSSSLSMISLAVASPLHDYYDGRDNPFGSWSKIYPYAQVRAFSINVQCANLTTGDIRLFLAVKPVGASMELDRATDYLCRDAGSGEVISLNLRRMMYQIPGFGLPITVATLSPDEVDAYILLGVASPVARLKGVAVRMVLSLIVDFGNKFSDP